MNTIQPISSVTSILSSSPVIVDTRKCRLFGSEKQTNVYLIKCPNAINVLVSPLFRPLINLNQNEMKIEVLLYLVSVNLYITSSPF